MDMQAVHTKKGILEAAEKRDTRQARSHNSVFCVLCRKQVRPLMLHEAEYGYMTDRARLVELIQNGEVIHRIYNSLGELRICSGSLSRAVKRRRRSKCVVLKPCGHDKTSL